MASVNQEFPSAPMGGRLIRVAVLSAALLVVIASVGTWISFRYARPDMKTLMGSSAGGGILFALVMMVPIFLFERSKVARFAIRDNCLVLAGKSYPLQGLVEVARDPEIMRRAVKVMGNGGLGAIRGRYWSKRVGTFHAFLSSPENAVVLRWPDRVVAVSPADAEFFMICARSAAGLR